MQEKLLENITRTKTIHPEKGLLSPTIRRGIRSNWYWFVISPILCISSTFIYLRYATSQYVVNASILIRDDSRGSEFGDVTALENLGLGPVQSSVDNELEVLKSRTLMESVVDDLQLFIRCFASGHVKTAELYEKSPFFVQLINPDSIHWVKPVTYSLTFQNGNKYRLATADTEIYGIFGDTILLPQGHAIIQKTKYKPAPEDKYSIIISEKNEVVDEYSASLKVQAANKLVSVVNISLTEKLPVKAEAIMQQLIENYLKASIDDKNRIADSTIIFINENLRQVSAELAEIEKRIENFLRSNHMTDVEENGKLLVQTSSQLSRDRRQYTIQLKILECLQKYIGEFPGHAIPSSLFVQDPNFIAIVRNYNDLHSLLKKTDATTAAAHPSFQALQAELKGARENLLESIQSQKQELQTGIAALNLHVEGLQKQTDKIPSKTRTFLDYSRQQQIKQELYTFLLKKRVEASISRSSTFANARIIDKPKADPDPVNPQKKLYLLLAGLIGFGFPLAILYLHETLNTQVQISTDVTSRLKIPILAEIGHHNRSSISVFQSDSKSHIAEQFRVLRTHIQFLRATKSKHVILLTSSIGGEGKSFIAANLCNALALTGKKTLLIELDLRKPKIANYLNLNIEGVTDHLTFNSSLSTIIQPSGLHGYFDVIPSGPLPPDPAELLCTEKTGEMISQLKAQYDFIILDTPPIGLVTDARLIAHHADVSLYVIRQQFTQKHQLETIRGISDGDLLPGLHLIINDVKPLPGYNYGYYNEEENILQRIRKWLKLNTKSR
ncbi:GumC family protein [Dyadobacter bucti]|uniref:GumC family protein n=1 Tax=Dyadobacter bucti TaxID=2572203 RepID=UPI0011089DC5|nr:tyrosine-protein kinase family protein [Dyadobacter bucti]